MLKHPSSATVKTHGFAEKSKICPHLLSVIQSNVSTQQLWSISSLWQCLLKYVHLSLVFCSSCVVAQIMAVFEEGFTMHLQQYKHQELLRHSVKRLLNHSAAGGKGVVSKVKAAWQTRYTSQKRIKKPYKGYGDTKLNVELQDGAGGENTKANAFFKRGKKEKGIVILCKNQKQNIHPSCWLFFPELVNRIIPMQKHSKDGKKTY